MEVVWGTLEKDDRSDQELFEGRSHISLPVLQTMIVEVKAILNDRPLTYTSSDTDDP